MLLVFGCSAPDISGVKLIGHGGLGPEGEDPMDSREALTGAMAAGLDGVELDVQLTADSVLVAFHDTELDARTTCIGPVHSHTWGQLKNCPNGERVERSYPISRVDSLLLDIVRSFPEAEFTLDIKLNTKGEWWPYLRTFSEAIARLSKQPELARRIVLECQTEDFLRLMHEEAPELPLFLYGTEAPAAMDQAVTLGCSGITLEAGRVSRSEITLAHERGLQVTLFGVSGPWNLRNAVGTGPDRIQVDHPQ